MKKSTWIFTGLILLALLWFYVIPKLRANKKPQEPNDGPLSSFKGTPTQRDELKQMIYSDPLLKEKVLKDSQDNGNEFLTQLEIEIDNIYLTKNKNSNE